MGEMGYFLMVLPCCPVWLSRKDLNSVTMVIMEWLWKPIRFSQFLCKRVIAIRWTFIPITLTLDEHSLTLTLISNHLN